jgi:multiple sugar transport system substrate-binding protein
MKTTITRRAAFAAAVVLAGTLAGCSGTAGTQAPTASAIAVPDKWTGGNVTLTLWNDNAAMKGAADLFNAQHADQGIKIEFSPNTDLAKSVRNAHSAGNPPDIFATQTADLAGYIAEDIATDLAPYFPSIEKDYAKATLDAVSLGGSKYGIPASDIPTFTLFNKEVFDQNGIALPTTYEDFLEAGKKLKTKGISVFNVAGEDPTTYTYMAWEAGAKWWELKDDGWNVNIYTPETRRAAEYFDEAFSNGLFSKISYAEYSAMMQEYNTNKIAARQLSTWQTKGMQANLTTGLGKWVPAPNLAWKGQDTVNAAFTRVYAVDSKTKNKDAAVFAAHWLSTNADSVAALASPQTGLGWFPAVADPSPYIATSAPKALLGDNINQWDPVVKKAVQTRATDWTWGPDYAGAFTKLQDLWGKAVAGQIKATEIAPQLQAWVVDDMKKQGYTVLNH